MLAILKVFFLVPRSIGALRKILKGGVTSEARRFAAKVTWQHPSHPHHFFFSSKGNLFSKRWKEDWKVWNSIFTNYSVSDGIILCFYNCTFVICPAQWPWSVYWSSLLLANRKALQCWPSCLGLHLCMLYLALSVENCLLVIQTPIYKQLVMMVVEHWMTVVIS